MENWGTYELTLSQLRELPTLHQGQADDCKIESDTERVWLSRCTMEDGEPWDHKVTVERYIAGSWVEVEWWQAEDDTDDDDTSAFGPYDTFTLTIKLGNDAMSETADLVAALRRAAELIDVNGAWDGGIMDANGNTVGGYEFS
jgi:hypothetical protein